MSEYLAIKSWAKFQPLRGKGKYIFDYTQQDDEPELAKLSFFQRGVYQEIRRYRGRSGKNMPNDHEFIAIATSARLKDRPRLPQAIRELIACGLLMVTNQELDSVKVGEKEIENEKEKDIKPSAKAKPRGQAKPTDPRFPHCIDILHRYWDKFAKERVRFDLWMDKAGYRQLKNSLQRHETMSVEEFTHFVANRARSPGVNHYQPAYEWVGHILDWAGGPKNGKGTAKITEQESRAGTSLAVAAGMGKVFGRTDAVGSEHVPDAAPSKPGNTG